MVALDINTGAAEVVGVSYLLNRAKRPRGQRTAPLQESGLRHSQAVLVAAGRL